MVKFSVDCTKKRKFGMSFSNGESGGDEEEEEEEDLGRGGGASGSSLPRSDGGESEGPSPEAEEKDHRINVSVDPDVLDCSVCFETLTPPVYQCKNGHIACHRCCLKLKSKCHFCKSFIGSIRCLAIEKVIESMTISCPYISYGCQEKVNYMQKEIHEKSCIHAPCVCPIPDCAFSGSSKQLSIHFTSQHQFHRIYNGISSVIIMGVDDPFLVLHVDDNHPLFILNNFNGPMGNAVWVTCVRPNCFGVAFRYNIKTKSGGCHLEFWSLTASVRERAELSPPLDTFLLIPHSFSAREEKLNLNVSILDSGF